MQKQPVDGGARLLWALVRCQPHPPALTAASGNLRQPDDVSVSRAVVACSTEGSKTATVAAASQLVRRPCLHIIIGTWHIYSKCKLRHLLSPHALTALPPPPLKTHVWTWFLLMADGH